MNTKENDNQNLPKELTDLVKLAMSSNITKEDFKRFLQQELSKDK